MRKIITLLALAALCAGCSTTGSYTVMGETHPKLKAKQVTLYFNSTPPPPRYTYDVVGAVSAVSRSSLQASLDKLKVEAAKMGANGVIVTEMKTSYGGSVGYSFGSASVYGNPYSATAYGSSFSGAIPVYFQVAGGTAIYIRRIDPGVPGSIFYKQ